MVTPNRREEALVWIKPWTKTVQFGLDGERAPENSESFSSLKKATSESIYLRDKLMIPSPPTSP